MVFSSILFICVFLPAVFLLYRVIPSQRGKNILLTVFSLVFYAFGGLSYLPLLLLSVAINYLAGLAVQRQGKFRKIAVVLAVVLNLGILGVYKYLGFFTETVNAVLGIGLTVPNIRLPIGISFFTFQGLSYVLDVFRNPSEGTKSPLKVLLYISFFPQLVAGPIVKYSDVAAQIDNRTTDSNLTASGILRFVEGLSKKLLLANTLGLVADKVFALQGNVLDIRLAWLGAICYTFQIYFDFSGYSDMAIGLGKMFGFRFLENFRFPYISCSIKEFWRRWHISLSSWFRDYLYIPMGGNRKGTWRARLNRLFVFFCTGMWHGANWTFVLWGLWHGIAILIEDMLHREKKKLPAPIGWLYTMLVVVLGFVLFRADSVGQAWQITKAMFSGFQISVAGNAAFYNMLSPTLLTVLVLAIVFSFPIVPFLRSRMRGKLRSTFETMRYPVALCLLAVDIFALAASGFNPFIYFQF